MNLAAYFLSACVLSLLNLICFAAGIKIAFILARGEKGESSAFHPLEAVKERKEKRKAKIESDQERERLETVLKNIEAYDGTGMGQEDVPER